MERETTQQRVALGRLIRDARVTQDRSQAWVAGAMKVHQATVSCWELGTQGVSLGQAARLSQILRVPLSRMAATIAQYKPECDACWDDPVLGFTCNTCGLSGGEQR